MSIEEICITLPLEWDTKKAVSINTHTNTHTCSRFFFLSSLFIFFFFPLLNFFSILYFNKVLKRASFSCRSTFYYGNVNASQENWFGSKETPAEPWIPLPVLPGTTTTAPVQREVGSVPARGDAELEICCGTCSLPPGEAKTAHVDGEGKTQAHSTVLFPSYSPGSLSESWALPAAMLIKADILNWTHRRFLEPVFSSWNVGTVISISSLQLPRELNKLSPLRTRSLWQPGTGSLNENAVYFLIFVFYRSKSESKL